MSSTDQEMRWMKAAIRSVVSTWATNLGVTVPFDAPRELVDQLVDCLQKPEVQAGPEPFTAQRYDAELAQLYGEMRSHRVQPDEARMMLGVLERRAGLAGVDQLQGERAEAPRHPLQDGEVTVIGPECFTDGQVICYQGENYVRQQEGYAAATAPTSWKIITSRCCKMDAPESSARRFTLSDETQDSSHRRQHRPGPVVDEDFGDFDARARASARRQDPPSVT